MNNEPSFTPGPWRYVQQPVKSAGYYICTVDNNIEGTFIGEVGGGLQSMHEIEQNAKLIAAAPELYKAVIKFLKVINRTPTALEHYGEAIQLGQQAIKSLEK